jgi:hypothetical protein
MKEFKKFFYGLKIGQIPLMLDRVRKGDRVSG